MEVLKQVIRLMKRIEGAFCPWSYLDQMDYFQQGGCNEEEAYAYANSNMADLPGIIHIIRCGSAI